MQRYEEEDRWRQDCKEFFLQFFEYLVHDIPFALSSRHYFAHGAMFVIPGATRQALSNVGVAVALVLASPSLIPKRSE